MLQENSGKEGNFFPYLNFTPNPKRLGCFFVSLFFQSNFSPLLDSPHYKFFPHVFWIPHRGVWVFLAISFLIKRAKFQKK